MKVQDAIDVAAFVASQYTVYQSEIFSTLLHIYLAESTDSRGQCFALAEAVLTERAKAKKAEVSK